MPSTQASTSTLVPKRAPPPPVPTSTPGPLPVPALKQNHEQTQTQTAAHTSAVESRKHCDLLHAIGSFFKRKRSDTDDITAPSDSEASQRSTSRWSHWSHRQSMPDALLEVATGTEPATASIQENESLASSHHMGESPPKKAKTMEKVEKNKKKLKLSFVKTKQSPDDPSELLAAESSEESTAGPSRLSFLFFGGSDVDSSFQPDLRPSELDSLHEKDIRPSLKAKMPSFFSPPLATKLRGSSLLPDPKEYEL